MSEVSTNVGVAELMLIADEPIDEKHLKLARKLSGGKLELADFSVVCTGRCCTWPLQVEIPSFTSIDNVGSHLWFIAGYLDRHRETNSALRALGCNLQLNLSGVSLSKPFSISADTLKKIGDMKIQVELRS